eukprot:4050307-Amphidinium_carterae.1
MCSCQTILTCLEEVEVIPGVVARALKVSFTGEEGLELHIPLKSVGQVYEASRNLSKIGLHPHSHATSEYC